MKKNIYNRLRSLVIISAVLWYAQNSHGQDKKHQFSVAAGGGFSHLNYDLKQGDLKQGIGVSLGVRYSYYLNNNWSIGLGTEYQTFSSTAEFDRLQGSYMTTDSEGESFEFRYTAEGFEEKQNLQLITIPLNFQYEGLDYPAFYASVGAKIGFAVNSSYETSIEHLRTSGYYPQFDVELFDPQFAGFGHFNGISQGKQDIDVNVSYIATFEAGFKPFEKEGRAIYIGLYLDYGLNNILKKDSNKEIIVYPETLPVDFKYNSVFDSNQTEEVKVMAYGVKLRYAFW
jgi:hypothetical protein